MPLRAKTRWENSARGLKGLAAGAVVAGVMVEQQRQWWWQCIMPTNKCLRPVSVVRSPVLWAMMSNAARMWFNCPQRGRGTSSHCAFMFMQHWQQVEPRPVRVQTRLLKYMSKELNEQRKAKSAGIYIQIMMLALSTVKITGVQKRDRRWVKW